MSQEELRGLSGALRALERSPDDVGMREECLEHVHSLCDVLAMGAALEVQLHKLMQANNFERAAKLVDAFASSGAFTRRRKLSRMF